MGDPMGQGIGFARPCPRDDEERGAARGNVCVAVLDGAALLGIKLCEIRFSHRSTESFLMALEVAIFVRCANAG
jgi:hypothetical protein